MQLIILGMHRSGTSVLARILNLMGAYFGPEGIATGTNQENPKGFWERRDIRSLNDRVLHAAGCDWDRVLDWDVRKLSDDVTKDFHTRASRIVLGMDGFRPWLLKEPRLCLLFPLWRNLLEAPVCLLPLRHPVEVASSLNRRNGIPVPVGLALWEKYIRSSLAASAGLPRIQVSQRNLVANPTGEIEMLLHELRLAGVTGLRMPSRQEITAFIDPALHRERKEQEALRAYEDMSQVRLFDALSTIHPSLDEPAEDLDESSRQVLMRYEAEQPRRPVKSPGAGSTTAIDKRLTTLSHELARLRERLRVLESMQPSPKAASPRRD